MRIFSPLYTSPSPVVVFVAVAAAAAAAASASAEIWKFNGDIMVFLKYGVHVVRIGLEKGSARGIIDLTRLPISLGRNSPRPMCSHAWAVSQIQAHGPRYLIA